MSSFWMPNKKPLYAPMLASFGGGSGRGYGRGGRFGGAPFDDMSNFPGATKLSDTLIVYLSPGSYAFTDPAGGSSVFRAYVIGAGGGSDGDGGGWYGVMGAGGGGGAVAEFSSSAPMAVGVGYGGLGRGGYDPSATGEDWMGYHYYSITAAVTADETTRRGRGGTSYIKESQSGNVYMYGSGGMPGSYGYQSTIWSSYGGNSPPNLYAYNNHNGGRNIWYNNGFGYVNPSFVSNASTYYGGHGGVAANKDGSTSSSIRHPDDLYNTYPSQGEYSATAGESTTYSGPGGGGGSDYENTYNGVSAAGSFGGTASGINALLAGSGYSSSGGNGSNYSTNGLGATAGTIGGGAGGNSRYAADTWSQNVKGGDGAVFLELVA